MTTSSKVKFSLDTLRAKALTAIDAKIADAEQAVAGIDDDAAHEERVATWRARQVARLTDLHTKLPQLDNYQLSRFRLDEMPDRNRWERRRAEDDLRALRNRREEILAKSGSLVADEDGNIALTKTQLREFFGL